MFFPVAVDRDQQQIGRFRPAHALLVKNLVGFERAQRASMSAARVSHLGTKPEFLFAGHPLRERNEKLCVGMVLHEELDPQGLTHR